MFGLELFLSRCQKLKVGLTASKIGRLHRTHDGKIKVLTNFLFPSKISIYLFRFQQSKIQLVVVFYVIYQYLPENY
jgi:hypothetical protein